MQWRRAGGLLVLAVGAGNLAAQALRALRDLRDTDYATFISAARILAGGRRNIYSLAALHAAEASYIGFVPGPRVTNAFLNPPPAALALVPLTGLPPTAGLAIFLAAGAACIAAGAVVAWRRLLAPITSPAARGVVTVAAVCSLPAGMNLALGQSDPFIFVCVAVALGWLCQDRRPLLCGVLLSALCLKPHLAYLLPVFLAATGQWRVLVGFAAGAALWAVSSVAILGGEVFALPGLILANDTRQTVETLGMPGFAGMLTGSPQASLYVWLALAAASAVLVVRFRRRMAGRPAATVALAVGVSLVVSPHLLPYDLLLLAFPLLWWARVHTGSALLTSLGLSAAWGIDVAIGPLTGPHLETIVMVIAVAGLALSLRASADAAEVPGEPGRRASWRPAGALPSTPQ